jgi:PAS domain S-box-containing protein
MFWKNKEKENKDFYEEFLECLNQENGDKNRITAVITYFADGILVFDRNGRLYLINPRAEKIFGVGKEKVLGKKLFELNVFESFAPLVSFLSGDIKEVAKKEIKIMGRNILETSIVPMITKGEKVGTLVVLHDITRERLVDMMKSEFVTVAAHQLRTPTSAIKWSLKMLLDGDLGEMPEVQRQVIEKTYNTNEKIIHLINDLLNVARLEEGKFLSQIILSDIEETIQSTIEIFSEEIRKKKIKFEFSRPAGGLPRIMIDVDKIKIALENLIDNAVRYTKPGGKINISAETDGKEITIQIQDTGVGIPENEKEKIFTKFFRGENIMKMETEGTGLGLFIAKNIVELHGGRIWFDSKEGEGTVFSFALPIKEEFAEYLSGRFY